MINRFARVTYIGSNYILWDIKGNICRLIPQITSEMFDSLLLPLRIKEAEVKDIRYVRYPGDSECLRIACEMLIHSKSYHDHIIARRETFRLMEMMKKEGQSFGEWFWERGYIIGDTLSLNVAEFFKDCEYISREEAVKYDFTTEELIYLVNGVTNARNFYRDKMNELCL